jgi:ubiquinone/menaquinone biosynthesis C-methylase UbiE
VSRPDETVLGLHRKSSQIDVTRQALKFTSQEISRKYDGFARWYDWVEGILNLLGLSSLRRRLLGRASGKVLEVAVGTGKNLPYYPRDCRITAGDLSREMLNIARKRAEKLSMNVSFLLMDAEALPFSDQTFDTVVSSLSTCTFPNPAAALKEMQRVCRTDGKILLLEHGRSDRERLGRWQDRHADQFAKPFGCHWNREPLELVEGAGLKVVRARRNFLGVFHQIEAQTTAT